MNEYGKDNLRRMVYQNQGSLAANGGPWNRNLRNSHRFRSSTLSTYLRSKSIVSAINPKPGQALEMIRHIATYPFTYGAQLACLVTLSAFILQEVIK